MDQTPTADAPTLSLVIPCYNEAKNLPLLIGRVEERFGAGSGAEVVLVDNGSSDDSPRILADRLTGHRVLRSVRVEKNQGYGFGILSGLAASRGRFLGWSHADMQTDPADALRALELIERSAEPERVYAKGERYGRPIKDLVFTVGMSAFETALLGRPLWDINAQPNVFPRWFYEAVAPAAPHDFSLDLYFDHEARRHGLRLLRFPVRFGERAHGVSHWNVDWKSKKKFIERTVKFSLELRKKLGAPGRHAR
jgi:glycosyltransferase involved in cell wall biosynthesis